MANTPFGKSSRLTRADRTAVGDWWWTIDKVSLLLIFILLALGVIMSFAASPPVARDLGIANEFHFVRKHVVFLVLATATLILLSMFDDRTIVRLGFLALFAALIGMLAAIAFGAEIKGSRRWLDLGFFQLQPSEFVKPALVIVCAWLFSEHARRPELKANFIAFGLFLLVLLVLVAQPDIGQAVLVTGVWGLLFFVAGMSMVWIVALAAVSTGGLVSAYFFIPHVTSRIDRFLNPESGDTHQTDRAIESFIEGGWIGKGPGEGEVKEHLPDSHTDFLFAVTGEEFGILLCLAIVGLYLFLFFRMVRAALRHDQLFSRFAIVGLVGLLAMQASINIGVNIQLLPAKGMTLPFLSYGGSSLLSVAFTSGVLLALARRRVPSCTNDHSPARRDFRFRWSLQGR
ncbi:MAG: putative peptidoglycan glycosyltransferase FtsW [Pseudomonadota bacterium]